MWIHETHTQTQNVLNAVLKISDIKIQIKLRFGIITNSININLRLPGLTKPNQSLKYISKCF